MAARSPGAGGDRRERQAADGLDQLGRWMEDTVRQGLARLELQPADVWEQQARRMTDAKAKGVAGWLRRLAWLPGNGPSWPARLLGELGRLALLAEAFGRLGELPPALRDDVRQLVGWDV